MQTTYDNRIYSLEVIETEYPQVEARLQARGFDGKYYIGTSVGTGRQHSRTALFLRKSSDGSFVTGI